MAQLASVISKLESGAEDPKNTTGIKKQHMRILTVGINTKKEAGIVEQSQIWRSKKVVEHA